MEKQDKTKKADESKKPKLEMIEASVGNVFVKIPKSGLGIKLGRDVIDMLEAQIHNTATRLDL